MTTVNDISDLVRILRDNPEWLHAIRELVLTEELIRLPETVARLTETVQELARDTNDQFRIVNARLGRLETDVAELKSGQERLEAGQERLEADVAELKSGQERLEGEQARTNRRLDQMGNQINELRGHVFEITAARRITPAVIQQMGLYHCDTIVGPGIPLAQERIAHIRQAELDGAIERSSDQEIAAIDLLLHGRQDADNALVWVVVEASVRIDEHDIARARRRADILAAVYHEPAVAVVVGESIDVRDQARADSAGVTVIALRPRHRQEEGE